MTARGDGAGECRHCERAIQLDSGVWIDPEATGDDSIWREVCDANDTFEAKHEPERRESYNESMDRLGWTRTRLPS